MKNNDLIPISELIRRAQEAGFNFGKGNPVNRLRYYTKNGLIPHAQRKQALPGESFTIGYYPDYTLDLLLKIQGLKKSGQNAEKIAAHMAVEKMRAAAKTIGNIGEIGGIGVKNKIAIACWVAAAVVATALIWNKSYETHETNVTHEVLGETTTQPVSTAVLGQTMALYTSPNLLQNPGFEGGWQGWQYLGNSGSFNTSVSNYSVRSGVKALSFQGGQGSQGIYQQQTKTINGRDYILSVWVRSEKPATLRLGFLGGADHNDPNYNLMTPAQWADYAKDVYQEFTVKDDGAWQEFSFTYKNAALGKIPYLQVSGLNEGDKLFVDDVFLGISGESGMSGGSGNNSVVVDDLANIYPEGHMGAGSLGINNHTFAALYLAQASIDSSGNLAAAGEINSGGNMTVGKNLTVKNTASFQQSASVSGSLQVYQSLTGNSASFSGGLVLSASPTISTTAMQSLTLGDSSTGNIILSTSLIGNGSTRFKVLTVADLPAGGAIGTAPATVDAYTTFAVNQTTGSQTITLPTPSDTTAGRLVYITNTGTASFTVLSTTLLTGSTLTAVWNGTSWTTAFGTGLVVGTVNNSTLRWNSATAQWLENTNVLAASTGVFGAAGNVGVGTTAPAYNLEIAQASGILNFSSSTGVKQIQTGGTTNLALMPGGNVGVGTTAPTAKLEVNGNLLVDTYATISGSLGIGTSAVAGPGNVNVLNSLTVPNLTVTNSQSSSGTFSITSNATTQNILAVTGTSLTSGTAISKTLTANAGNGQVTKGEILTLTDSTTAGGGYTGIGISVSGSGTGTGNKYLLDLNPSSTTEAVFDSTGSFRPTTAVSSNTNTIGSSSFYWKTGYFDQVTANTLSGTVAGGATSSTSWTIGSTQTGDVNESLIFQRNSGSGNATLQWNAGSSDLRYLTANYPVNTTYTVSNSSIGTGINLLSANLTNNTTSGTQKLLSLTNTGTGTTADGIYISNTGTLTTAIELNGTFTNALLIPSGSGNVGIGTTSPSNLLHLLSTTTPQLRIAYDASNYLTQAVGSNGATTLAVNGTLGGFTITNPQPASVSTSPGTAAASALSVTGGTGGNTTLATTATGGIGGTIDLTGGIGGQVTAVAGANNNTGGKGGTLTFTGGTGGAATTTDTGTNTGGAGGDLYLVGGAGGSASNGSTNTAGTAGNILLAITSGGTARGNVGIGITAPTVALDVVGAGKFSTSVTTPIVDNSGSLTIGGTNATGLTLGRSGVTTTFSSTSWTATPTISGLITATSGLTANGTVTVAAGFSQTGANTFSTGTGAVSLNGATTIATSATVPLIIGGTGAGSSLSLQSTSGVGTSDFIKFLVGNNGGTEAMRITTAGNVGIGTTSPAGILHVAGQCVAAGTKIRRRRKNKKGEWEEEEIPVEDIKTDDEVLSLDEEKGQFAWHKVERTMAKGIQASLELLTSTGKRIITTNEHPYLIINHPEITRGTFEVDQSIKVEDLSRATIIGLALGELTFTAKLSQKEKKFLKSCRLSTTEIFAMTVAATFKAAKIYPARMLIDQEYPGWNRKIAGIIKKSFPDTDILFGRVLDSSGSHQSAWAVNRGKKQAEIVLKVEGQTIKERPGAKIARRMISPMNNYTGLLHPHGLHLEEFYTRGRELSRAKWTKADEVELGQYVATTAGFEKIVGIRKLERLSMFDLQIANTHNFVANGIVAHNTSIFGAGEGGTPTVTTIRGAAASGTNIAGANFTFDASNGTGTGGSGALIFRTAPTGSTGATANTLAEIMRITPGGNVGIGTTTPGAHLHVSGSGTQVLLDNAAWLSAKQSGGTVTDMVGMSAGNIAAFGALDGGQSIPMAFYTVGAERVRIDTSGNVGIGTTSPAGILHVAGQCVTGDTLLKRRKKKRSRNKFGMTEEWEDVPIKDIAVGDEILTLDEETGKFVVSPVRQLMDKGTKEIVKITTESGKTIRTTSEHPYLVLTKNGQAWVKIKNLKTGVPIATLGQEDNNSHPVCLFVDETGMGNDPSQPYFGVGAIALTDTIEINTKFHVVFEKMLSTVNGTNDRLEFKFNNIRPHNKLFYHQLLDILFASPDWEFNALLIKKGGKGWTPYSYWRRYVGNIIELTGLFANNRLFVLADYLSKPNVSQRQLSDILRRDNVQNIIQLESQGSLLIQLADIILGAIAFKLRDQKIDGGTSEAKEEIAGRVWEALKAKVREGNKKDGYKETSYRLAAVTALSLCRNAEIVLQNRSFVKWEKIAKIERLPAEQVYDLEVENTHNFVANGIVAHNTSIFGAGEGGTPTVTTIRGAAASGTNIAGANFTFDASNGTGTGGSGALIFRTAPTGSTGSTANTLAEIMRITPGGNVGIGTTAPGAKLDINGTLTVTGSNLTTLGGNLTVTGTSWTATPTISGLITATSGLTANGTVTVAAGFSQTGANTFSTGTGAVSLNGATTIATSATVPLIIGGTGAGSSLSLQSTSGVGTSDFIKFLVGNNGGTEAMRITTAGNVGIGTTGPGAKLDVQSTQTSGTLIQTGAPSAVTLTAALTGEKIDLSTNYTTANAVNVTGLQLLLPALTQTSAGTSTYVGYNLSTAGALVQNTLAGTINWTGLNIQMPNITQTTGTVTATGLKIAGGTVTSGTSYGLIIDSNAGNVGIGITAPTNLLDVYTGASANSSIRVHGNSITTGGGYLTATGAEIAQLSGGAEDVSGTWTSRTTAGAGSGNANLLQMDSGAFKFFSAASLTNGGTITWNEKMRLSAAGGLSLGNGSVGTDAGAGNIIIAGGTVDISPAATTLKLKANTASALIVTDGTNTYQTIDTRTATSGISAFTFAPGTAPTIASAATAYFNTGTFTPGTINFSGITQITSTGTSANNALLFNQPTINRTAATNGLTIDQANNLFINGPTIASHATAGQTETITASSALRIGAGSSVAGTNGAVTNAYGLYVNTPTGATNNIAAYFEGNVGIGTTGPAGILHVAGQCVAMGTKIRRKRRKGLHGLSTDDTGWEDIPVEDIKIDDEVLTLDETTGEFVWSKVEKTMDKGTQNSFELTTAGGKKIETTSEHPYLVKESRLPFAFIDETGIFDSDGNSMMGVGALHFYGDLSKINRELREVFLTALNKLSQEEKTFEFKFNYVKPTNLSFYRSLVNILKKYESQWEFTCRFQKRTSGSFWKQYLYLLYCVLENLPGKFTVLADYLNKPGDGKQNIEIVSNLKQVANILQMESQGSVFLQLVDIILGAKAFILSDGKNIYRKKIALEIEKLLKNKKRAGVSQAYAAREAGMGFHSALTGSVQPSWIKVKDLMVSQEIATEENGQLRFEKIISIKNTGRKSMFDLQIANTHNFVANGIVAHNTSIFGAGEGGTPTTTTIRGAAASGTNIAGANLTFDASNGTGTGGSGALIFRTAPTGTTGSTANTLAEIMRITPGGNVGIGTTGPDSKLQVAGGGNLGGMRITYAGSSANYFDADTNYFRTGAAAETVRITATGLGLGGVNPGSRLGVNGGIAVGTSASYNSGAAPTGGAMIEGNVGIGTTGPSQLLEVSGTSSGGNIIAKVTNTATTANSLNVLRLGANNSSLYGQLTYNNNSGVLNLDNSSPGQNLPMTFSIQGSEKVRIDGGGNVGIGTTGPLGKLHIAVSTGNSTIVNANNGGTGVTSYWTAYSSGYTEFASDTGGFRFANSLGGTSRLAIDSSGNVGIGTTAPAGLLDVSGGSSVGTLYLSSSATSISTTIGQLMFRTSGTAGAEKRSAIIESTLTAASGTTVTGDLEFLTNNAGTLNEKMRISAAGGLSLGNSYVGTDPGAGNVIISGNVGIGTVSPTFKTEISHTSANTTYAGDTAQFGLGLINSNGSANTWSQISFAQAGSGSVKATIGAQFTNIVTPTTDLVFGTGGASGVSEKVRITSAGNVGIGTTGPSYKLDILAGSAYTAQFRRNATDIPLIPYSDSGGSGITPANNTRNLIYIMPTTGILFYGNSAEVMRIQDNGNVGIGTTGPGAKLSIGALASGDVEYLAMDIGHPSNTYQNHIYGMISGTSNANNYLRFKLSTVTAGTSVDVLTLNGAGNVGIGTTNPGGTLQVSANTTSYLTKFTQTGTGNADIRIERTAGTTAGWEFYIPTGTTDLRLFDPGNADRVTFQNGGNVGIGTTGPSQLLEVSGTSSGGNIIAKVTNTATTANSLNVLRLGANNSSLYGQLTYNNNSGVLNLDNSSPGQNLPMTFSIQGSEKVRIDGGGNVGIGTTGPSSKLEITGTGTFSAAGVSALTETAHTVTLSGANPTTYSTFRATQLGAMTLTGTNLNQTVTTASTLYVDTPVAGANVTITNNKPIDTATGAYLTSGGAWTNASDRALKENFTKLNSADILAKINQLPVTSWNYKSEGSTVKHIGPVAQDFAAIFQLGNDDKSISSIDPAGIALVGIQALTGQIASQSAELATKKSAEADLVNQIGSLTGWLDNLAVSVPQGNSFVKGISADKIYLMGMDSPGLEPGRFGLSSQPNEPVEPILVSLSQFLSALVKDIPPDISAQIALIPQIKSDVDLLKEQMASVSAGLTKTNGDVSSIKYNVSSISGLLNTSYIIHDTNVDVATISASFANFSDSLKVIGKTQLAQTTIGGALQVGLLHFDDLKAEISSLTGLVTINSNLKVMGDATISGKLRVENGLIVKDAVTGEDYCVKVASGAAQVVKGECQ